MAKWPLQSLVSVTVVTAGCAGATRAAPARSRSDDSSSVAPMQSSASPSPASSPPPPASEAPHAVVQPPCTFVSEPPATVCGATANSQACSVRAAFRIQCASGQVTAFAAHDARHAAIVIAGQSTWLTEFAPETEPQSDVLYDAQVINAALAASHDGGYRLLASDAQSPRLLSIYAPSPASHGAATAPEWIEMRDTRAVGDLVETADGRSLALIYNGSVPGPVRLLTRSIEGAWSDRLITEQRISPPHLALDANGHTVVTFVDATARAPFVALHTQIDAQPVTTITPWTSDSLLAAVLPSDATVPVIAYTTRNTSRVALVDERGRVRGSAVLQGPTANTEGCQPALNTQTFIEPSECRTNVVNSEPPVFAAGRNGVVWAVNVEHHIDMDRQVDMHCMPVDPPGHTGRHWVPPRSCEFHFTLIADRSSAELVVRRLDSHARTPVVTERARLRLSVPPTAHRLRTIATVAGGVLHVLVTEPFLERSSGVYLAIDE